MILFVAMLLALGGGWAECAEGAPKGPSRAPTVKEVHGGVKIATGRADKPEATKVGARLVEHADIRTESGGQVKIDLDGRRTLTVLPSSTVQIPVIRWEGGEVPLVVLTEGRVRWTASEGGDVRIESKLFDLKPPSGDYLFVFDPKSARAEVLVYAGQLDFSATNGEVSVVVPALHKAVFQGVMEEGEIAADLLLKGRRVPRGNLSGPMALDAVEKTIIQDEEKRQAEEVRKKKAKEQRRKAADRREGLICRQPSGRLNDCSWICEGNPKGARSCRFERKGVICARKRCNANGVWAERSPLPDDEARLRCRAPVTVGPCDY